MPTSILLSSSLVLVSLTFSLIISNQAFELNGVETTNVVNTLFCSSCSDLENSRRSLYYDSYQDAPNYARLTHDPNSFLPPSFTICLGVSITINKGQQMLVTIRGKDDKPFLGAAFSTIVENNDHNTLLNLIIGSTWISMVHPGDAMLPNQWVRNCLSFSFENGMVEWVIDGKVAASVNITETLREESKEALKNMPANLTGKIILGAIETPGGWVSPGNRVTNLNIFASALSTEKTISMTTPGGDNCGEGGDYLEWADMQWALYGQAVIENVSKEEPCTVDPKMYVYYSEFNWIGCMRHCQNMGGRIPKIVTFEESQRVQSFLKKFYASVSYKLGGYWLSVRDDEEEGVWRDFYTKEVMEQNGSFTGVQPTGSPGWYCIWETPKGEWFDNACGGEGFGIVCMCDHEQRPLLNLRGACPNSKVGPTYVPHNSRQDMSNLQYLSKMGTVLQYEESSNEWQMFQYDGSVLLRIGRSEAHEGSFLLGKHNWIIENDTHDCSKGKPYTVELKLTGCNVDQFTCNDGQCVSMDFRCNQVPNCRDKSDEERCNVLVLEDSYNKNVPPIISNGEKVNVSISIDLLKLVDIKEEDYSIEIQFSITLEWLEKRATYQNLKHDKSLNALTEADVKQLWLPRVIYENTDQKETTRLGEFGHGEWDTGVIVVRQGDFNRSSLDVID